jgi:hypothetical protein
MPGSRIRTRIARTRRDSIRKDRTIRTSRNMTSINQNLSRRLNQGRTTRKAVGILVRIILMPLTMVMVTVSSIVMIDRRLE